MSKNFFLLLAVTLTSTFLLLCDNLKILVLFLLLGIALLSASQLKSKNPVKIRAMELKGAVLLAIIYVLSASAAQVIAEGGINFELLVKNIIKICSLLAYSMYLYLNISPVDVISDFRRISFSLALSIALALKLSAVLVDAWSFLIKVYTTNYNAHGLKSKIKSVIDATKALSSLTVYVSLQTTEALSLRVIYISTPKLYERDRMDE